MKRLSVLLSLPLIIGLFAGCNVVPVAQKTTFDQRQVQFSTEPGSAAIKGSAFLKTMGGDVKVAAGEKIELIPACDYTDERFRLIEMNINWELRDPRLAQYVRETRGDAQGNFEFTNIPAGRYYLSTYFTWVIPGGMRTGGQAIQEISVTSGETKKVVLTR